MRPIDVTFTNSQFKSLAQYVKPGNVLSPLPDPATTSVTGRLTNREVVQTDGKLHEDIAKILSVLENPAVMANLKCLNTKQLMDIYWYSGNERVTDGLVSLANQDGEIRLQAPSPEEEYLFKMRAMLGAEPVKYIQTKGTLDVTAAWLFWILLDEHRKGHKSIKPEDVRKRLEAPFNGLTDLGAYFSHTLDLLPPSRSEIEKGLASLAAFNIIQETAKGISLSADLGELALDLKVVRAHVHFAVKQLNRAGEVESLRYWLLQGNSRAMLLWYEVDGDVVFRVITPAVFYEMLTLLLRIEPTPAPAVPVPAAGTIPGVSSGKVVRYQPPTAKRKSPAGRMLTSFLIGLLTIAIGLFTSGYLTYTPGNGVAVAVDDAAIAPTEIAGAIGPTAGAAEPNLQDIQVEDVNVLKTSDYTTSVFGRLVNTGASAVGYVTLKVDLLDSSGSVIQTVDGWSLTNGIEAGGESYFMAEVYDLAEVPASASATVDYVSPADMESKTSVVDVSQKQITTLEYNVEIIGDALNTSAQAVEIVSVTGVLLDSGGNIIGLARSDDYNIGLNPGENMPVKATLYTSSEASAQAVESRLLVETIEVDTVTSASVSLSTASTIIRSPDGLYFVSELMNTSSKAIKVQGLAAAFYDASGNLLDVTYSYTSLYLEPGAISPYILEGFNRLNLEENQGLEPASFLILATKNASEPLDSSILTLDTEVINENQYLPDQWFLMHGNVINNNSETIAYGTVTVSLRDPVTGSLVSTYSSAFSDLTPGASTEFTVYLPLPPGADPAVLDREIRAVGTP